MKKPKKNTLIVAAGIIIFIMSLMSPNPAFTFAFLAIVVAFFWMMYTRRQKLIDMLSNDGSDNYERNRPVEDEPKYNFDTFRAAERPVRKKPHPDYENPLTEKETSDWEQIVSRYQD